VIQAGTDPLARWLVGHGAPAHVDDKLPVMPDFTESPWSDIRSVTNLAGRARHPRTAVPIEKRMTLVADPSLVQSSAIRASC